MKRIAVFTLLVALGVTVSLPAQARTHSVPDASQSPSAAKTRQKMMKKRAKQERKEMKRSQKELRKEQKALHRAS
jgi:hypothetical protein